ncbi:hypothetical protein [Paenibacillus peoriae]|uniref:hypothetical protein n=1 Tax=Paenibacillus peoriae TaxID=59893 RepID=UPI003F53EB7C
MSRYSDGKVRDIPDGLSKQESGPLFKENFEILDRLLKEDQPTIHSHAGLIDGTDMRLIPKPVSSIPTKATVFSNQSINWIARNGDGWLQYPIGDPAGVKQQLHELIEKTDADEIMAHTDIFDHKALLRSYEILAQAAVN